MEFMKTVDFFSSPIGLGHITRDIAIAANLRDVSINFVSGSGAIKILSSLGIKATDAYVPPPFVVEDGALQSPAKWLWNYYRYYKRCKEISREILLKDSPDMVVSDEDFASLANAQDMGIRTVLVTDILETRFTGGLASLVEKRMNKSMRNIMGKAEAVIVPEHGDDRDNIRMVGPIVRRIDTPRDQLRERFGFERKTVLVSIGGTDAGVFLIEKTLEAIPNVGHDIDVVLVSGPAVKRKFKGVRNLGWVDNLHELILAADLIVSLAGRSTMDEALAYGTPAVFIPIKGHFEQEDNARRLGFAFEDVRRLDILIAEKIQEGRNPLAADGAEKAAKIIQQAIV